MSKRRVLVIDEDAVLRDFLKERLTGEGFEVDTAPEKLPQPPARDGGYDYVLSNIPRPFSLDRLMERLEARGGRAQCRPGRFR